MREVRDQIPLEQGRVLFSGKIHTSDYELYLDGNRIRDAKSAQKLANDLGEIMARLQRFLGSTMHCGQSEIKFRPLEYESSRRLSFSGD